MHIPKAWWSGVIYIIGVLKSPFQDDGDNPQKVLDWPIDHPRNFAGPIFDPPSRPEDKPFQCEYPAMKKYVFCSQLGNRQCWLKGPDKEYNIKTNYEVDYPEGITRKYYLEVTSQSLAPDGVEMPFGQVFNKTYPGPWIEACWGDTIEITVKNLLNTNGTTIHWHGIRQLGTTEMDGVNAVTQCPIAPGASFTYRFKAMQYGTSWYHSHYSLQYGVGLLGPMTIHGPSSHPYHEAKDPILMTDWSYRNSFDEWSFSLQPNGVRPAMKSILLNGKGQYVPTIDEYNKGLVVQKVPKHELTFQRGKLYLLRIINTSVDSTFIFSIDNHDIIVVGMDFVPITPYRTKGVLVGIGQRYHIVVEANPSKEVPGSNYWIRTTVAQGCSSFSTTRAVPDERTGILRYQANNPFDPLTDRNDISTKCADEPYDKLKPILEWQVSPAAKADVSNYSIGLTTIGGPPYYPEQPAIARWDLTNNPMWLNMSRPTVLNLNSDWSKFPHLAAVTSKANDNAWVEILITLDKIGGPVLSNKRFVPVAHPLHLHGHDFALLAQSSKPYDPSTIVINRNNPPRRDVALVPSGGYILIAFKADNPGVWLMHCHIAFHASSGLALQIIENADRIVVPPQTKAVMQDQCQKWDKWFSEHNSQVHPLQDDSGI